GLESILKVGEPQKDFAEPGEVNLYAQMIGESEEFEKIELLQIHNNTYIKERAYKLLKTYWEEEDDVTPPGDVDQPGFGFEGANSVPAGGLNFNQ
ncbi:importin subunit alpha-2-like protein, partial [Tanacetum coccineum]